MVIFVIEKELDKRKLRVYTNGKIKLFYRNNWRELTNNTNCGAGYCQIRINNKHYYKHRVVGWAFLGLDINNLKTEIDHKDGNRANNHISNLRVVSHQQNNFNKSFRGYTKIGSRYYARIHVGDINISLGGFEKEEDAHNAYLSAKIKYHVI